MPRSQDPNPILTDFFDNSTIHGLKQLSLPADSIGKKIFWIFVLLGCFIGGSYEIYQVVSYYRLKPSATQVSWTIQSEYEFPPMAFCPKRWLRVQKAREIGLTDDALAYAISFLQSDHEIADFDENKILLKIRNLMAKNRLDSYAELLKSVAYDERGLLRVISTPSNLTFLPSIIESGMCYIIKVAPLKSGMLRTNVMLKLQYTPPSRVHEFDKKFQSKMLIRDYSGQKTSYISFSRHGIYEIAFTAEVHHRLSRTNKPCSQSDNSIPEKWFYTASDMCEKVCISRERVRRRCAPCVNIEIIDILDLRMNDAHPCSHMQTKHKNNRTKTKSGQFSESGHCTASEITEIMESCKFECVPPCKQWIFKSTTNVLSETTSDGTVVTWITYNPIDGILSFEEVPTYTWDTFLSNVGGQLGLWLGISVISVIQVFYYCSVAFARAINARKMGVVP